MKSEGIVLCRLSVELRWIAFTNLAGEQLFNPVVPDKEEAPVLGDGPPRTQRQFFDLCQPEIEGGLLGI